MANKFGKGLMGLVGLRLAPKVLGLAKNVIGGVLDVPKGILGLNRPKNPLGGIHQIYKRTGQHEELTSFHAPDRPSGILGSFRGMFDKLLG